MGYRLDLGCVIGPLGCDDESDSCTVCFAPMHLAEESEFGSPLDVDPVASPPSSLEIFVAVPIQVGEVEYIRPEISTDSTTILEVVSLRGPPADFFLPIFCSHQLT